MERICGEPAQKEQTDRERDHEHEEAMRLVVSLHVTNRDSVEGWTDHVATRSRGRSVGGEERRTLHSIPPGPGEWHAKDGAAAREWSDRPGMPDVYPSEVTGRIQEDIFPRAKSA
jgi:hypothetical protein